MNKNSGSLQAIEITDLIQDLGVNRNLADFLVFDSLSHKTGSLKGKPFRSKHFSVIIVLSGILDVKVNLFEYHLITNDVIIIPPSAIRQLNWEEKNIHFISLLFTPDFLQKSGVMGKYFNVAKFLNEGLMSYRKLEQEDIRLLKDLLGVISAILDREFHHPSDVEVIRNLFRAILVKVKQYFDHMETDQNLSGTIIYRYLNLLSENYLLHREVSFYADKLNINPKYLTQLLKKKTGKTARQFIIDMVVMEAKILLDNKSFSVKEIAEQLNFENQFHFSRFFKQSVGNSPTEYRRGL